LTGERIKVWMKRSRGFNRENGDRVKEDDERKKP
jgi:hypothetical protein